jgi:putative Mg2+ transporter-C (MgtC) family protein
VLQGLLAGLGFLVAGTILKQQASEQIQGLTTAAGLWLTAAIGVAVGLGREAAAVLGTGLALVILAILPQVGSPVEAQERPREPSDTRRDDAVPSHNP